ncbi:heparin lyase I family protein [Sphingobium sp. SCG-1]|uniref:heparin lyase I family protein n=1 Tax=Sphingobium sp. SCG-1 TaxID=2072936 RepID=UPI00166FE564|nr:heparin lyase I family protein [Sphingobium sp. SCG-1]
MSVAANSPPKECITAANLRHQNTARPWSFTQRKNVSRFEVRSGDHIAGDGAEKERSEAFDTQKFAAGQSHRISFEMLVESGRPNSAAWLTLVQLQSTFDRGENGHSAPVAVEMLGEHMRIVSRADQRRVSVPNGFSFTEQYRDTGTIRRNRWYKIGMRFKFDPFNKGYLGVWRDGKPLVEYHGPLGFNDAEGAYFKQGVYRASAPEAFAAQFRRLSICTVEQ